MKVFSIYHFLMLVPLPFLFLLGERIAKKCKQKSKTVDNVLFVVSVFLTLFEIAKQIYMIKAGWSLSKILWNIPWHLCSGPIYLWLFFPLRKTKFFHFEKIYIRNYCFIGGIAALVLPTRAFASTPFIIFHTFIYHYALVFISGLCTYDKEADFSKKSFWEGSAIFLLYAAIAIVLNIVLNPYGEVNFFFLNVLKKNTQIIIRNFPDSWGILTGHIVFMLAVIVFSWIAHIFLKQLNKKERQRG